MTSNLFSVDDKDKMTEEQRTSFKNGFEMIKLPVGTELWRFVSTKTTGNLGAFWMKPETMKSLMTQMKLNNNYSKNFIRENIRDNLAILGDWSDLSLRQKIRIKKEIIAYKGLTQVQKKWNKYSGDSPVRNTKNGEITKLVETRFGGYEQYVIPRLKGLMRDNEWAEVVYFQRV
jgi:hypothetical protein